MKKIVCSAIAVAMITGSLVFAQSQGTPPTPAQRVADHVGHLTTLLSLTASQQTEATTILTAEETSAAGLFANMKTARTALETAIEANDTAGISAAAAQIGNLTTQQTQIRATGQAELYALLNPDQQAKYKQLISHGGPGGGFGGRGPGGFGGPRPGPPAPDSPQ